MRTDLIFPTIHLNGTSADDLLEQYRNSMRAVGDAMEVLSRCAPNGRDYYPQSGDAIGTAIEQHRQRREKLQEIWDEQTSLAVHCSDTINDRESRKRERETQS